MTAIDRRAMKAILALCDIDREALANRLGYERRYVNNVLCGSTRPSPAFCRAFGDTIAELVFGDRFRCGRMLPVAPLLELVRRRARYAPRKRDFYSDNGINMNYLGSREFVSEIVVDRICSALGVHPSSVYGVEYTEEAS
ncbi:MAG: helix-turn-helix domain-containing protein [Actinomycetota bacterium]|nr:helix-turn-helix domain-containing protein [Actinomycetota bacterium]